VSEAVAEMQHPKVILEATSEVLVSLSVLITTLYSAALALNNLEMRKNYSSKRRKGKRLSVWSKKSPMRGSN
jgi:hypothetical protein